MMRCPYNAADLPRGVEHGCNCSSASCERWLAALAYLVGHPSVIDRGFVIAAPPFELSKECKGAAFGSASVRGLPCGVARCV